MKNTAESDPIQTTDPRKGAVDQDELRKEPREESDNTEESKGSTMTNEGRTDELKLRITTNNRFIFAPKPEARIPPLVKQEEVTQKHTETNDESHAQLGKIEEPKVESPDLFGIKALFKEMNLHTLSDDVRTLSTEFAKSKNDVRVLQDWCQQCLDELENRTSKAFEISVDMIGKSKKG